MYTVNLAFQFFCLWFSLFILLLAFCPAFEHRDMERGDLLLLVFSLLSAIFAAFFAN